MNELVSSPIDMPCRLYIMHAVMQVQAECIITISACVQDTEILAYLYLMSRSHSRYVTVCMLVKSYYYCFKLKNQLGLGWVAGARILNSLKLSSPLS